MVDPAMHKVTFVWRTCMVAPYVFKKKSIFTHLINKRCFLHLQNRCKCFLALAMQLQAYLVFYVGEGFRAKCKSLITNGRLPPTKPYRFEVPSNYTAKSLMGHYMQGKGSFHYCSPKEEALSHIMQIQILKQRFFP